MAIRFYPTKDKVSRDTFPKHLYTLQMTMSAA